VLKPEIPLSKALKEGELQVLANTWQLLDFTDLGFWVFGIRESTLQTLITPAPFYGLRVQGITYALERNPLAPGILQLFLSERIPLEKIRAGTLVSLNTPDGSSSSRQEEPPLTIELVIIDRPVENNGTTLYAIPLTDYFNLRQPLNELISLQNACILPSYILTNEENTYEMETYLAARLETGLDTAEKALLYLKRGTEAENKELMSFVNPNRVSMLEGVPHISVPDRRDRIRELGVEGIREGDEVYVLINNPVQFETLLQVNRTRLPELYDGSFFWKASVCGIEFLFTETEEPNILQINIPNSLTTSWELIRNGRFEKLFPSGLQVTAKSPESGSLVNRLDVLLEWEGTPGFFNDGRRPRAVPEITEYRVYFAATVLSVYPEPTAVIASSLQKTGLNYNTEYKWKVVAVQNDGQTATTEEATFRTLQDPSPDPNRVAVNAAIALIGGANPIAQLPVPGGNTAAQAVKTAAVKAYLQALPGMGGLGVTLTVLWNQITSNYFVNVSKSGVTETTIITVTAYTDTTPDQTAVDTAIGLVNGEDPIASLAVSGGATGTITNKEAAVKAHLEGLPGMAGLGVTLVVAWDSGHNCYNVTINKDGVTESTTIAVSAYTDSTPNLTAVNTAVGFVNDADPIASLAVPKGDAGSDVDKKAAVKAYLETLPGMGDLGVVISVNWNAESGRFDVTILKGTTIRSTTIAVTGYTDSTPNQTAVSDAIDLVDADDPIGSISVSGGAGGSTADKEAAVKAHLESLPGMSGLGVNIAVVWNGTNYTVTITKGGASESTTIAVTAYTDSTPDLTSINTAKGYIDDADPIESVAVPKGAAGTEADKEAAVKAHLEGLPGMSGLGVTLAVAWNAGNNNYDVTITKNAENTATTVAVTGYTDSTPDQTAVDNAIDLVDADDPIATIAVSGGAGGSQADKEAAIKAYLEDLHGMPEQGVTITVAWNGTNYTVTITKGGVTDTTTIAVTGYVDSDSDLTSVSTAKDYIDAESPIDSIAVPKGVAGTIADKEAAVKAYLENVSGIPGLGVTIGVARNAGNANYDVTITKNVASTTTEVTVNGYTDSTPDQTAVDNAIDLVDADDPIGSISVSGGAGGSTADKEAAVKAHLESLPGMSGLGVNIAVVWNGTNYTVTITKGGASESTTIAVTAYKGMDEYTEGSGTEGDPYMIENWYQLDAVRNGLTAHYKLKNTLDKDTAGYTELASSVADGGKGWNPIGIDINTSFLGVFDGDGKLIKDVRINRPTTPNIGLFGHVGNSSASTVVKNVGMQNTEVRGARASGTLIGRVTGNISTVVENCFSSGGFVYGDAATGGLVGSFNSYRENPGQAENFRPIMRRCYADIDVHFSGNGTNNIKFGGLVGCAQKGFVGDSYARGSVSASTGCERVGGIAGCIYLQGRLFNTYSTGVVTGNGALNVGGHVGFNAPGNEAGTSTGSYWDTQTSGQPSSAAGTGKSTTQMKQQATFVNWDFTTIWDIDGVTNDGYPFLRDIGIGITLASRMEIQTQPSDNLVTKPGIRLLNSAGYLVAGDNTTVVTVEIRKVTAPGVVSDPIVGILTGTTSVTASNGVANFADLGIAGAESGEFVLRFSAPGLDIVNSESFSID
jgi:hypothetical protein